ncbi:MAG: hypothetical protein L0387_12880, partial [Acidobacteria bacterium]|nr:hypothetical protein [Acidobacteriota bacterium]
VLSILWRHSNARTIYLGSGYPGHTGAVAGILVSGPLASGGEIIRRNAKKRLPPELSPPYRLRR